MGTLFADITPLRAVPAFRRYYLGQLVSIFGSALTILALRYQAYKLGGDSTTTVALLALATLVPLVVSSIVGGSIADAFDRRKILLITQVLLAACSLGLALNARAAHPKLWVVFVLAATSSALVGVDWPTRTSVIPNLVGPEYTQRAISLNIALFNLAGIGGPVLAGFVVQRSVSLPYFLDAASYGASFAAVLSIPAQMPHGEARKVSFGTIADGFRYVKGHRTIRSTFAADLGAMIFGLPDALFPAMAEKVFTGGPHTLGYLQAAPAVGAVLGSTLAGWTTRVRRQGRAVIWCIVVWGLGIAAFGSTSILPLALLGLAVAGGADSISAIFRSTIVQKTVPDEYRGRLSAVFVAVVRGGPRLGEFESGLAASVGGLHFAAVSGGLACIAWIAAVVRRYPELSAYIDDGET